MIPVITQQFDKKLIGRYDYVVELMEAESEDWAGHDITQIPDKRMFDVKQQKIREAIEYKPLENDGEVLPRILDMSIACYDMRKSAMKREGTEFLSNSKWLAWMIEDSMDVQPLRVQFKEDHSTVQYEMFTAKLHIDSRKTDTTTYHVAAIESSGEGGCNHIHSSLWNHMVRNHLFHAIQESCYIFKPT